MIQKALERPNIVTVEQKAILFGPSDSYKIIEETVDTQEESKGRLGQERVTERRIVHKPNSEAVRFCEGFITGTQVFERCEHTL